MLYAGGNFTHQSLPNVINIAKFDGTDWLPVGPGLPGQVTALAQSIDGSLIAFGKDSQGYMAKWDGTTWTMIEQNLRRGSVFTAALGDIGHGTRLYFGGNFDNQNTSPGPPLSHLALYDGQRLLPIGNGLEGFKPNVARAFKTFDDGSGEALYIGGAIQWAGQVPVNGVARWDGTTWSSPGATFADLAFVTALEVAPTTTGQDRLLAATRRIVIGGSTTNAIEQWDGTTWTQHTPANGEILALHHVPTGPFAGLYAAGNFTQIGGITASFLARQDTTTGTWSALNHGFDKRVTDVILLQNATETSLFACGRFTAAGGQPASGLARWTGTQWQGISIPGATRTKKLEVYDVGNGPQLFFAGNVAGVWDGSTITPITQAALFQDVAGFDDGSGPAVYFAGARRVLRFSAQPGAFLPMGPRGPNPTVSGVVERVTLNGQTSLFFGDPITHVRPIVPAPFEEFISSGYIAQYLGCGACYADCDQSTGVGTLDIFDFLCFQNSFVNANPYACDCDTSTGPGVCDIFDFLCFQSAFVAGCP